MVQGEEGKDAEQTLKKGKKQGVVKEILLGTCWVAVERWLVISFALQLSGEEWSGEERKKRSRNEMNRWMTCAMELEKEK